MAGKVSDDQDEATSMFFHFGMVAVLDFLGHFVTLAYDFLYSSRRSNRPRAFGTVPPSGPVRPKTASLHLQ